MVDEKKPDIPLQDVSTDQFLEEMGFNVPYEETIVIPSPPADKVLTMHSLRPYREDECKPPKVQEPGMECFFHDCKLEKRVSKNGWEYVRCPREDCVIFCGVDQIDYYLENAQRGLITWYRWNADKLRCFCSLPLTLCESKSDKNPFRMYFKCKKNTCNFFQWGDLEPTGKNMAWIGGKEQAGTSYSNDVVKEQDPLMKEILATPIRLLEGTKQIADPPELKGYWLTPFNRERLYTLLYLTRKLKKESDEAFEKRVREYGVHRDFVAVLPTAHPNNKAAGFTE